jgi:hypothetical protein
MENSTVLIPLTGKHGEGKFAVIDAADEHLLCGKPVRLPRGKYPCISINGKTQLLHRYIMSAEKGSFIDHIDHNKLNNSRSNLRVCTKAENRYNVAKAKLTCRGKIPSSIYKGVSFDGIVSKWRSVIFKERKQHYLGWFDSEVFAAEVYDAAAMQLFGEFAFLNFEHSPTQRALDHLSAPILPQWRLTAPDGRTFEMVTIFSFCITHGLHGGSMSAVASGKHKVHKGWTCERINREIQRTS